MNKQVILKISNMHCSACAMNIDGELEDTPGVQSVSTNYAKAETRVAFDAQKVTVDKLLEAVQRAGYNAAISD